MIPARIPFLGDRISILVLSRGLAEKYTSDQPYAMISIGNACDIGEVPLQDDLLRRKLLRLKFTDDDAPSKHGTSFEVDQATEILEFIRHLEDCTIIVCHCEMGMSRSAAVAAAISHILNRDDEFFFKQYTPNMWVYRQILNLFHADYE